MNLECGIPERIPCQRFVFLHVIDVELQAVLVRLHVFGLCFDDEYLTLSRRQDPLGRLHGKHSATATTTNKFSILNTDTGSRKDE